MQGMVPLSGFGGVPYSAVRKAAPRNILDNSDFTNLVAQAGIGGNHGSIAYAADRWILDSGTVSYAAGVGLTLNGTIRQKLEFPPTGETSAFVGMASGAASISYADGAVTITSSVHGVCGIFGTLMTGLLAVDGGAFYGGGFGFFAAQTFGILVIDVWAAVTGIILFWSIKKLVGLRVDKRIEEEGLDIYEHGESCFN